MPWGVCSEMLSCLPRPETLMFARRVLRKEFERAAQILRDNANPLPQLFEPYQNSSK